MLTIQPPQNNGGLTIDKYWIRSKQEGQEWTKEDEHTSVRARSNAVTARVVRLTPEKSYYFGVCAENTMGKGDFLDTHTATVLPKRLGMYVKANKDEHNGLAIFLARSAKELL